RSGAACGRQRRFRRHRRRRGPQRFRDACLDRRSAESAARPRAGIFENSPAKTRIAQDTITHFFILGREAMHELEVTWSRVTSILWLILWLAPLGSVMLRAILCFVIGFIGALSGVQSTSSTAVATIVGALAGLCWGIFVVRMALRKNYSGFRIALVPT